MVVAILQSNYFPWKGYFDIIHDVDLFVFYDDVQYTKTDWRNRNLIKTPAGPRWLTVPVGSRHRQQVHKRLICEVEIKDPAWQLQHWNQLLQNYRAAPYYSDYEGFLRGVFRERTWTNLSELNQYLITTISRDFLSIKTAFADSRQYCSHGQRQDRIMDLLRQTGATRYLSGPSAKAYMEPERFAQAGIDLIWKRYDGYPQYAQLHPPFEHNVSILDLLFHTGPAAGDFIWNLKNR